MTSAPSDSLVPARRHTPLIALLAVLAAAAAAAPFLLKAGSGPRRYTSIRGVEIVTHGIGPYRDMPADVAVQGFAQDLVTLTVGLPLLLATLAWARTSARAGHLALTGVVGYFFVQYFMYLGMGTYNELFLLWVALVLISSQALARLLLARPPGAFATPALGTGSRRYVGGFLMLSSGLIALLWLQTLIPPLVDGRLYPPGLAHFTTMIVQGYDLALFLPCAMLSGIAYWHGRDSGELLGPVYAVFLSLQMLALLAKIVWMSAVGVSAGPALVVIPLLLAGAVLAAVLALRAHQGAELS